MSPSRIDLPAGYSSKRAIPSPKPASAKAATKKSTAPTNKFAASRSKFAASSPGRSGSARAKGSQVSLLPAASSLPAPASTVAEYPFAKSNSNGKFTVGYMVPTYIYYYSDELFSTQPEAQEAAERDIIKRGYDPEALRVSSDAKRGEVVRIHSLD